MFTLVTACMNREAHLRQSLPRWLAVPQMKEILVVDWSNHPPLDDLRAIDSRVKVLRVTGERKWILSYAYNAGIARATQSVIVKCDADCIPSAELLNYAPGPKHFFAGYWRSGAAVGKPSVNGQCIFLKSQFQAVNGYSELIRTYGRDDEDFYDRLIAHGYERKEIPPTCLNFVAHSNDERVVNQFAGEEASSIEHRVLRDTLYNEMHNCWIARLMPWNASRHRATFLETSQEDRLSVVCRDQSQEIPIPAEIEAKARLLALRYLAMQLAKISDAAANTLNERACLALIGTRMSRAPQKGPVCSPLRQSAQARESQSQPA
jgi:hypothetical protein